MKPEEALMKAADLIELKGWCQDYCAVDDQGEPVTSRSLEAARFCAFGAICKVSGSDEVVASRATDILTEHLLGAIVPKWNDCPERTKAEVVQALRAAAKGRA